MSTPMLKILIGLALTPFQLISPARAGQPFNCSVHKDDGSVLLTLKSERIVGHGMDGFAMGSLDYSGTQYVFNAQSNIFNDSLSLSVSVGEYFAMSTGPGSLYVSAPGAAAVSFQCKPR